MIDFPPAPAVDDIHTYLAKSWQYTGSGWKEYVVPAVSDYNLKFLPLNVGTEIYPDPLRMAYSAFPVVPKIIDARVESLMTTYDPLELINPLEMTYI